VLQSKKALLFEKRSKNFCARRKMGMAVCGAVAPDQAGTYQLLYSFSA